MINNINTFIKFISVNGITNYYGILFIALTFIIIYSSLIVMSRDKK